jgi:predicted nuclease with TOPRIM domain
MQKLARLRLENAALREEHRAMMAKFEEQQRAMEEIREAIAINEDKIIAMCPDYYPGWSV